MKKAYIIATSFMACTILYLLEQAIAVDYVTKTIAKIVLFVVIPYIYLKFVKKSAIKDSLNLGRFDASTLKLGFILGLASFAILIAAYFIFRGFIDFDSIAHELQSKSKITPSNFILVGLYISFGNSFLEEFFFRGYVFLNLYNEGAKKLGYIYSSVLFAVYHIAIFKTWFNPALMGLALLGLIIVGLVFDWLDTKTENFMNSWLLHILADSAIIIIGLKMFDMI
ncbi:MAG: CPBP family intramembrane metalloprotease [Clostridiaceae bacterium]|nr:CPBP family intramembrane metalloprotease [Clostridiaceae bacterium]